MGGCRERRCCWLPRLGTTCFDFWFASRSGQCTLTATSPFDCSLPPGRPNENLQRLGPQSLVPTVGHKKSRSLSVPPLVRCKTPRGFSRSSLTRVLGRVVRGEWNKRRKEEKRYVSELQNGQAEQSDQGPQKGPRSPAYPRPATPRTQCTNIPLNRWTGAAEKIRLALPATSLVCGHS